MPARSSGCTRDRQSLRRASATRRTHPRKDGRDENNETATIKGRAPGYPACAACLSRQRWQSLLSRRRWCRCLGWRRRRWCRHLGGRTHPSKHAIDQSRVVLAAVPLGLNHDKNGGDDNQNQQNSHFEHPPYCARVKYTNGEETKRAAARLALISLDRRSSLDLPIRPNEKGREIPSGPQAPLTLCA